MAGLGVGVVYILQHVLRLHVGLLKTQNCMVVENAKL
jgi:hypothetical protein